MTVRSQILSLDSINLRFDIAFGLPFILHSDVKSVVEKQYLDKKCNPSKNTIARKK